MRGPGNRTVEQVSLAFAILVEGPFDSGQMVSRWSDRDAETTGSGLHEAPATLPAADGSSGQTPEYSDRECRLVDWQVAGARLYLTFALARLEPETAAAPPGKERAVALSDGLGVCSVVKSSDGLLIVQERSNNHIRYPGWYHVCGGMLEVQPVGDEQIVDPFSWMQTELDEELTIDSSWIASMRCLGLVRDLHNMRPELAFETVLTVPTNRFAHWCGPEHSDLVLLDDAPDDLRRFVADHGARMVPSGLACLLMYGKRRFGQPWYHETLQTV